MQLFSALMFGAAALDLLLGNRLGLGSALREGLNAIIELLLLMTGFMALAPWMAGAVTKLKSFEHQYLERIFNFKYPYEYIDRFEEMIKRKNSVYDFYKKYF